MSELNVDPAAKKGEPCNILIGGKTVKVSPMPLRRLKGVLKTVIEALEKLGNIQGATPAELIKKVPSIFIENFELLAPEFLAGNDFANAEWIQDNLALPDVEKLLRTTLVVNGLEDFFGQMKGKESTPAFPPAAETAAAPTEK